jgi:uncharacterized protein
MSDTPAESPRLITLDVIRGIAVMGIFSVNIVGMAMIEAAYYYPPAFGFDGLADRILWAANFILVDGKMRSLFSILFGASMLLVLERAEAAGRSPAQTHLARMAALLLIGLIHFYAIWWGDILTLYAMVGALAYLFWRLPAGGLLMISVLLFAWHAAPRIAEVPDRISSYEAATSGKSAAAAEEWRDNMRRSIPDAASIARDKAVHASAITHARKMIAEQTALPVRHFKQLWPETLALMLLGMWGYRSRFLTGGWSDGKYRLGAAVGLGIGVAGFSALAAWVVASDFRLAETASAFNSLSAPLRPVMALGYAALIILLFRRAGALRDRFAAVGRAAFTNYIGASLIGLLVFSGSGLGLYAQLSRAEAWLLVPIVWAIMLAWSKPWLDRFAYGPLEWAWRSLARWELQPMRRRGGPLGLAAQA